MADLISVETKYFEIEVENDSIDINGGFETGINPSYFDFVDYGLNDLISGLSSNAKEFECILKHLDGEVTPTSAVAAFGKFLDELQDKILADKGGFVEKMFGAIEDDCPRNFDYYCDKDLTDYLTIFDECSLNCDNEIVLVPQLDSVYEGHTLMSVDINLKFNIWED